MTFDEWYATNRRRFHCAHMNEEQIAEAAWDAGREAGVQAEADASGASRGGEPDPDETQRWRADEAAGRTT